MTNVKNLAASLEFNEEAQIIAIKSNMPRDVYGLCMQYNKFDELKKFLIELFENPRMKSAVPSITAAAELQHSLWENFSTMMWSQLLPMTYVS